MTGPSSASRRNIRTRSPTATGGLGGSRSRSAAPVANGPARNEAMVTRATQRRVCMAHLRCRTYATGRGHTSRSAKGGPKFFQGRELVCGMSSRMRPLELPALPVLAEHEDVRLRGVDEAGPGRVPAQLLVHAEGDGADEDGLAHGVDALEAGVRRRGSAAGPDPLGELLHRPGQRGGRRLEPGHARLRNEPRAAAVEVREDLALVAHEEEAFLGHRLAVLLQLLRPRGPKAAVDRK